MFYNILHVRNKEPKANIELSRYFFGFKTKTFFKVAPEELDYIVYHEKKNGCLAFFLVILDFILQVGFMSETDENFSNKMTFNFTNGTSISAYLSLSYEKHKKLVRQNIKVRRPLKDEK